MQTDTKPGTGCTNTVLNNHDNAARIAKQTTVDDTIATTNTVYKMTADVKKNSNAPKTLSDPTL